MLSIRSVAFSLGAIFILTAVVGFIPNPLVAPDGVFAVNAAHNVVHLLTGGAFIGGAWLMPGKESALVKIIGAAYLLVAVVGFFTSGDMLLGFIHINQADRWLHLGLALLILAAGFGFKPAARIARA